MKKQSTILKSLRSRTWWGCLLTSLLAFASLGPLLDRAEAADRALVTDPQDMADSSGDIRAVGAQVMGSKLYLSMTVEKVAAPSIEQTPEGMNNRYYYHWLLDTDNNPATGRSNAEYEGTPTGVLKPIGAERAIMIAWRDGKPGGIEVYDPLNEEVMVKTNFTYQARGNTLRAVIPLADIGLTVGQTIAVSAFQEGSSDGWAVDWMESAVLTLEPPVGDGGGMTLATQFSGDPVGFEILVEDDRTTKVDDQFGSRADNRQLV